MKMSMSRLFSAILGLAVTSVIAHERYIGYDLGTLPTTYQRSAAKDVNNAGVIIGTAYTNSSVAHGFCYSNGVMRDLGTVGGKFDSSFPLGINEAGTIVGQCVGGGSVTEVRAFQYKGGTMSLLPVGGLGSWANDVNASDEIVGHVRTNSNNGVAFVCRDDGMTNLGVLGGAYSEALKINNNGVAVGYSTVAGSAARHAFVWSGGLMSDLGTLGGASSQARSINDGGSIVGDSDVGSVRHAFVYAGGVMTDLGSLGGSYLHSFAFGINNNGTIVGYANTSSNPNLGNPRAFSYSDGVMTDLTPFLAKAGFNGNSSALAINDNGWIVGQAGVTGGSHAFLLVPDPTPVLYACISNGVPQLTVEGDIGSRFALEFTAELPSNDSWICVETNVLTTIRNTFPDTTAAGVSVRFYRARLVE